METNSSGILIQTQQFSFMKIDFEMLAAKWWPICFSISVYALTHLPLGDLNEILDK